MDKRPDGYLLPKGISSLACMWLEPALAVELAVELGLGLVVELGLGLVVELGLGLVVELGLELVVELGLGWVAASDSPSCVVSA